MSKMPPEAWIPLGMLFGIPIGVALGNVALGPALGLPLGVALYAARKREHDKDGKEEDQQD